MSGSRTRTYGLILDAKGITPTYFKFCAQAIRAAFQEIHGFQINKGLTDRKLKTRRITIWFAEWEDRENTIEAIFEMFSEEVLTGIKIWEKERSEKQAKKAENNIFHFSHYKVAA